MKVKFIDGVVIVGNSYSEIVDKMHKQSFECDKPIDEYMKNTANRVKQAFGEDISYDNPHVFLNGLRYVKLIKIEG